MTRCPAPSSIITRGTRSCSGELTEAIALVGGAGAYGTAEHGHIFGSGERWAAVDPPGPSNECVTRDGVDPPWFLPAVRPRRTIQGRTGSATRSRALRRPRSFWLSEADVATHGKRLGLPARNFLEGWDPVLRFITQRESASPAECRHISLPTPVADIRFSEPDLAGSSRP